MPTIRPDTIAAAMPEQAENSATARAARSQWLNRSTVGVALASLFSDVSHELATAVLPSVLLVMGGGAAALGIIEGVADGASAFAKLYGGALTDRVRRKKPLASIGYLITAAGTAAIAACTAWWQALLCRVIAWIGRGSRSPARDVLMTEATDAAHLGKVFGMERAGDALGAVIGPLIALLFVAGGTPPRSILWWSLLPGSLAFLAIALVVRERPEHEPKAPRKIWASFAATGLPFRRYLIGIGIFGAGDFSRTLLILYVMDHVTAPPFGLSPSALAIALYVLHNAVSAAAAFPIGVLTDRFGRRRAIVIGYGFAAATTLAFGFLPPTALLLTVLFICSGLYIACEEVAEKACAAEMLPREVKGAGMGMLAAVNGVGDTISSALVGGLLASFPGQSGFAFCAAAALQLAGAFALAVFR